MGSDESSAQGHHNVATHTWTIAARARDASGKWTRIDNGPQSTIRCDSSPEFPKSYAKACVFADHDPRFTMSVDDPDIAEVADHIKCAQDEWLYGCDGNPGPATYPRIPDGSTKDILPGTWLENGPSSQGLTRIKDKRWTKANRRVKGYACESTRRYKKTGLPPSKRPSNNPGTECDEFPFATTWEGANNKDDSATVELRNVAPKLKQGSPEPWQVYRVEDKVAVKASFTDPGANDTHTCAFTWDDGTTSEKKAKKHACDKPHVFDEAGMFTVTTKVTDDDGGADSARVMVIVYDPRAGLLTATGKAGDARFIAAGKYLTADSPRPLGALAFTAREGGDRFKLTSLKPEWLVITHEGRAAMKGTGRLNGEKGYGYVAYAKAGGFRAVVWPLSDGTYPDGSTWYDNAGGESYDLDRFGYPEVTTGAVVIDSGWIPGVPRPVSGILADLT